MLAINEQKLAELLPDSQSKLNTDRDPIDMTLLTQQYGDMASDMLDELLPLLLMESASMYQSLLEADAEQDAEGVWQAAHMLRGAALSIGAIVLADLCDVIEVLGKAGELTIAKGPIGRISAELARLSSLQ